MEVAAEVGAVPVVALGIDVDVLEASAGDGGDVDGEGGQILVLRVPGASRASKFGVAPPADLGSTHLQLGIKDNGWIWATNGDDYKFKDSAPAGTPLNELVRMITGTCYALHPGPEPEPPPPGV